MNFFEFPVNTGLVQHTVDMETTQQNNNRIIIFHLVFTYLLPATSEHYFYHILSTTNLSSYGLDNGEI